MEEISIIILIVIVLSWLIIPIYAQIVMPIEIHKRLKEIKKLKEEELEMIKVIDVRLEDLRDYIQNKKEV